MANRSVMRPGFFAGTYTVETGARAVMRPGSYVIETEGNPVPSTVVFRRTLSPLGTRVGSRQVQGA